MQLTGELRFFFLGVLAKMSVVKLTTQGRFTVCDHSRSHIPSFCLAYCRGVVLWGFTNGFKATLTLFVILASRPPPDFGLLSNKTFDLFWSISDHFGLFGVISRYITGFFPLDV